MSLDNLSAIGKKEALMLTKEQIEMMLRINAPEVTLVQHIVRRPDLEKYWTYIRKINVNGHQTVWTQCTSKYNKTKNAFKGGEMSHYLNCSFLTMEGSYTQWYIFVRLPWTFFILRVVHTQAILFLKSMSEKVGSDIERR